MLAKICWEISVENVCSLFSAELVIFAILGNRPFAVVGTFLLRHL